MNGSDAGQDAVTVVGLGEALFDCFDDRKLLGGAPVNFTVHVHRLLAPRGGRGVLVSRVGEDPLGKELIAEVESRGITTDHIQTDSLRSTGRVNVVLSDDGQPTYDIAEEVAWDYLSFEESLQLLSKSCQAICFGSLAQRSALSRVTIGRFLAEATQAVKLFDVNLRQNYYSKDLLRHSLDAATAVKMNEEELIVLGELIDGAQNGPSRQDQVAQAIVDRFHLDLLALTRGKEGTVLYQGEERVEGAPAAADGRPDADTVGAGDACCAGIVVGMLSKWPLQRTADLANRMGAFVASQPGGTPQLSDELLDLAAGKDNRPRKT